MAWETRGRGRRCYYYRAKKVGGRVIKEYIGGGELGEAIAALDLLESHARREQRQQQQACLEVWQRHLQAVHAPVRDFSAAVDETLSTVLSAAGYHRHARGEWRKKGY
jgi:hypothetical protein